MKRKKNVFTICVINYSSQKEYYVSQLSVSKVVSGSFVHQTKMNYERFLRNLDKKSLKR